MTGRHSRGGREKTQARRVAVRVDIDDGALAGVVRALALVSEGFVSADGARDTSARCVAAGCRTQPAG